MIACTGYVIMMGCCCSHHDGSNTRVRLIQVAGESELLYEGGRPTMAIDIEEMTESARHDPASEGDSEVNRERSLTSSMVSNKDSRYWRFEFKGT